MITFPLFVSKSYEVMHRRCQQMVRDRLVSLDVLSHFWNHSAELASNLRGVHQADLIVCYPLGDVLRRKVFDILPRQHSVTFFPTARLCVFNKTAQLTRPTDPWYLVEHELDVCVYYDGHAYSFDELTPILLEAETLIKPLMEEKYNDHRTDR